MCSQRIRWLGLLTFNMLQYVSLTRATGSVARPLSSLSERENEFNALQSAKEWRKERSSGGEGEASARNQVKPLTDHHLAAPPSVSLTDWPPSLVTKRVSHAVSKIHFVFHLNTSRVKLRLDEERSFDGHWYTFSLSACTFCPSIPSWMRHSTARFVHCNIKLNRPDNIWQLKEEQSSRCLHGGWVETSPAS